MISKEICQAEQENMNIHPPSPINALVSPLLPSPSLALFCSTVQLHCGQQEKCDIDNASQR